jgi:hypothetical protein
MQTIVNGKEYKYYNQFEEWLNNLKESFIKQKDYKGFPVLPENNINGFYIYTNADAEERRFIFGFLLNEFTEALRHWKVDKDMLWTEEGRKQHEDFIKRLEPLLPYMKKDWDKFYQDKRGNWRTLNEKFNKNMDID